MWMLVAYLATNLFQAAADWIMADISQRALKQIRRELFEHLQSLSLSFFDHNPAGELMSRLTNDIDAINQAVSQNVTSLCQRAVWQASDRHVVLNLGWRWLRCY
jgi:ATP-binding cassette subfamily B protein